MAPSNHTRLRQGLVRLRAEHRLRQIDVALAAGVSERTVQYFETGMHDTSARNLIAMLGTMGYELEIVPLAPEVPT